MSISKRMLAGRVSQGTDAPRTYTANMQSWADDWGNIVSVSGWTLYDQTTKQYVNNKLSGDGNLNGNTIESPTVSELENKHLYQLNAILLFPNGQYLSGYFLIKGEL